MATPETYTIDASGKSLGRVASEAAKMLMGKTSASYTPNVRPTAKVSIVNVGKLSIRERKQVQKTYTSYSGYPGGLKKESLSALSSRRGGGEVMRRAIERMLPRNSLRVPRMKNLTITV